MKAFINELFALNVVDSIVSMVSSEVISPAVVKFYCACLSNKPNERKNGRNLTVVLSL